MGANSRSQPPWDAANTTILPGSDKSDSYPSIDLAANLGSPFRDCDGRSEFSITKAIPPALAYMLAAGMERPVFGLVLNGSECLFLKLAWDETPKYARSDLFSLLNRGNDLYTVLRVLKRLKPVMAPA